VHPCGVAFVRLLNEWANYDMPWIGSKHYFAGMSRRHAQAEAK
jgi:hypothetical protein